MALAVMLAASVATVSPADAAEPEIFNGKILLTAIVDLYGGETGELRIYSINPDRTGLKQLTSGHIDGSPEWSPDGARIAFSRQPLGYGPSEIWVMNADGTGQKQITTSSEETDGFHWNAAPTWSPDGGELAFMKRYIAPLSNFSDIYRIASDGSGDEIPVAVGRFFSPQWSPNGTKIAYAGHSTLTEPSGIFVSNPDGTERTVPWPEWSGAPFDWSPDNHWILSMSDDFEMVQLSADGQTIDDLSSAYPDVIRPHNGEYAPDGTKVAAGVTLSEVGPPCDVRTFNVDGTGTSFNLTGTTSICFTDPAWAPTIYPFIDILDNPFRDYILWAYREGITTGCTTTRYCPGTAVTREQMAAFLDRALALPATSEDFFTDDDGRTLENSINRVAAAGITSGCTATRYCPTEVVTREQMASFLARGFQLPPTDQDFFTDDETSTHEIAINRVAAAGITSGCTATTYCPKAPVTRAQMAAFLHRALK